MSFVTVIHRGNSRYTEEIIPRFIIELELSLQLHDKFEHIVLHKSDTATVMREKGTDMGETAYFKYLITVTL